jgi:hypothetical protein
LPSGLEGSHFVEDWTTCISQDPQYLPFSGSIAGIGDIDGDGVDDIASSYGGDDQLGENAGAVWLLFGGTL